MRYRSPSKYGVHSSEIASIPLTQKPSPASTRTGRRSMATSTLTTSVPTKITTGESITLPSMLREASMKQTVKRLGRLEPFFAPGIGLKREWCSLDLAEKTCFQRFRFLPKLAAGGRLLRSHSRAFPIAEEASLQDRAISPKANSYAS